jgi:hypothetical protein
MAKAKNKEVEEPVVEEIVEEVVVEETEPKDNTEAFITRKLRAINGLENQAKARRLADRLLRKRR